MASWLEAAWWYVGFILVAYGLGLVMGYWIRGLTTPESRDPADDATQASEPETLE
jgi:hypothetical protein